MKPNLCKHKDCTGCGVCAASCHRNAITMHYDKKGFLAPKVDNDLCIGCHTCENKCPVLNIKKFLFIPPSPKHIKVYTAWSVKQDLCMKSSSGGVFSQLAEDFLMLDKSFVSGVEQEKGQNTCRHIVIFNRDDLDRILGTRYVQSDASSCYSMIKKLLKNGYQGLFVGTPCQIAGLKSFIGDGSLNENLYCCEILCHGVTSKLSVDLMCRIKGASWISSYRNKRDGWCVITSKGRSPKSQCCTYEKNDGTSETESHSSDIFYKCFGAFHRTSCYHCMFAKPERLADITLGDQWGAIKKYQTRLSLGASLVIANSAKGERLLATSPYLSLHKEALNSVNAYPYFYPAVNCTANLSWLLPMMKHLPNSFIQRIMTNDLRHLWILFIHRIILKIGSNLHERRRKVVIKKTQKKYEW